MSSLDQKQTARRVTDGRRGNDAHNNPEQGRPAQARTTRANERRRARVKLSEIGVPKRTHNLAALRVSLRALDVALVCVIILLGVWNAYVGMNDNPVIAPIAAGAVGSAAFIIMLRVMRAHAFAATETLSQHLRTVGVACMAALGLWLGAALMFRPETFLPDALARAGLVASFVLLGVHLISHRFLSRLHAQGALQPTIVMLGATPSARRLIEHNARTRELNIAAIFDERLRSAPHNIHGVPVVGTLDDLLDWDALPYVDRVVVALPSGAQERVRQFADKVRLIPNRIAFVSDDFESLDHVAQRARQIANISLKEWTGEPKPVWHTVIKRLMDVSIAGLALVCLFPLLLIIAALIKLDSPGPALFRQPREGFNGRIFNVLKFRSLRVEHEDRNAASQVVAGDSRVTKIGRIIRKTSIDELPQLWNVVRGEMSLVGPRPHTPGMKTGSQETRRLVAEYAHRHKVKPGMTGWAQICGSRGPLHDSAGVERRVALDIEYIENASIWWDVVIMAKTIPCLLGDAENIR